MSKNVKNQIIRASKWSTLSEVTSKAVTPITYFLLAKILSPQDFGIATIPLIITAFCQILWDQGFSKAIIQDRENSSDIINIAFWYNLGMSLVLYLLVALFSNQLAVFFNAKDASIVIKAQGIIILLTSVTSVYSSILLRQLDFKSLFFARVIPALAIPLISIPLALLDFNYWALVFGTMGGAVVQCAILVINSKWSPKLNFEVAVFRKALRFSLWSTTEGILTWFYLWFDSVIVGYFLSSLDLGLYRTGGLIVASLYAVILSPIFPVLFASLSEYQFDSEMFSKIFRNASKIVIILASLIGCLLFATADIVTKTFLNAEWNGVELVIMILGLSQALSWLIATNTEAFRAKGKVSIVVRIMLIGTLYYLPTFIFTSQMGLEVFLWARLALVILTIPIYLYFSSKLLTIPTLQIFIELKYVFIGAGLMTVFISIFKTLDVGPYDLLYNFGIVVIGIAIFLLFLLPYKNFIIEIMGIAYKKKAK
jgi:PST family polysaccharide transporter